MADLVSRKVWCENRRLLKLEMQTTAVRLAYLGIYIFCSHFSLEGVWLWMVGNAEIASRLGEVFINTPVDSEREVLVSSLCCSSSCFSKNEISRDCITCSLGPGPKIRHRPSLDDRLVLTICVLRIGTCMGIYL